MAASTTNVTLLPGAGWTQLTSANITAFLRLSKLPKHSIVYLQPSASKPSTPVGGFRWTCEETFFEGALATNMWARIQNNANDEVIVSVFAN